MALTYEGIKIMHFNVQDLHGPFHKIIFTCVEVHGNMGLWVMDITSSNYLFGKDKNEVCQENSCLSLSFFIYLRLKGLLIVSNEEV